MIACCIIITAGLIMIALITLDPAILWKNMKVQLYAADETVFGGTLSSVRRNLFCDPDRVVLAQKPKYINAYEWLPSNKLFSIAHGLGPSIPSGNNTLETFQKGMAAGFNIFEVDITLTTDGELVCYHGTDGEDLELLSVRKFIQMANKNNFYPLRFRDLIELSKKHPDIYFILDVKNKFIESYEIMDNLLKDNKIKSHFIPQVYHFNNMIWFIKHPGWGGVVFTSYQSRLTTADIFFYARLFSISVVTLTLERISTCKDLPTDIVILAHPVNDPDTVKELHNKGVRGIYTHYLSEQTIKSFIR